MTGDAWLRMLVHVAVTNFLNRRVLATAVVVGAALFGVRWWAAHEAGSTLREQIAERLESALRANLEALTLWREAQLSSAQVIAADDEVITLVRELVARADAAPQAREALIVSAAQRRLRARFEHLVSSGMLAGWLVANRAGVNIGAAWDDGVAQRTFRRHPEAFRRALAGEPTISLPYHSEIPLPDELGIVREQLPILLVAVPMRVAGDAVDAVLALRMRATDLSRVFVTGRAGAMGEAYAFDASGLMLTESRFDSLLQRVGLLPEESIWGATHELVLREPPELLGARRVTADETAAWPLTKPVREASARRAGVDVEGYRDYRGVLTVGAWRWLPEWDMGIVVELNAEEAYRSLHQVQRISAIVFSILVFVAMLGVYHYGRQRQLNVQLANEVEERRRAEADRAHADAERRRVEHELQMAQKLESVGRLAAGVAHELNTPLQFVGDSVQFVADAFTDVSRVLPHYQGLVQRALTMPELTSDAQAAQAAEQAADLAYLQEEVPRALERARDGTERAASIVRALKEFAHPGNNELQPADLNKVLNTTLTVARNEYKYVADVETELGELPMVPCLPNELSQVVLNLVVNAAHAIGDVVKESGEKGTIRVRSFRDAQHAIIALSDTGTGIPEEIRPRIFDPFFTTKEVGRGSGQGLAIARNIIVDKHHGLLDFDTEPGKGTTFYIRLPLVAACTSADAVVTG